MSAGFVNAARGAFVAIGLALASGACAVAGAGQAQNAPVPAAAPNPTAPSHAPATPAPAATAAADPAAMQKGRDLFANWSCGSCHTLADAGGSGHVGPVLDGDTNLSEALVIDRVTNGQGAMPSFGGQMTDAEIKQIAAYIVHAAAK